MTDDARSSGITNTSHPFKLAEHLADALHTAARGGDPSNLIYDQETRGQLELVVSADLPTRINYGSSLEQITALGLGIELGEPYPHDPMFRPAKLPAGWEKRATAHSMWSNVVDEHGRARISIFYKAAFYDRDAFMNVVTIPGYVRDVMSGASPLVLDDQWATADAVREAAQAIRDSNAEKLQEYPNDEFYAGQVAAADRVLAQLPEPTPETATPDATQTEPVAETEPVADEES